MVQKQQPKKEKKGKPREQKPRQKKSGRTSLGRRKIEIKRIDNHSNRQVTLSKRRKGLFNKAAELCILTGAEIGIIARAENGKINTFCHPNLDGVIHAYVNGPNSDPPASFPPTQIDAELVEEDKRLSSELKAEKKLEKKLKTANAWWNEPVDNLGLEELEQCLGSLIDLRNNVMALSSSSPPSEEAAVAEDKGAVVFKDECRSPFMGVSDNVEMEQTVRADELDLSDYFDLEHSMLADELLKDSQTALNDFSSTQEDLSLGLLDSFESNFSYLDPVKLG